MSLVKLLAGRKRDSLLWDFFTYDAGCDKSSCMVVDDKTKLECGAKITGKNTSNLGSHLKRHHKDAHEQYLNKEKLKEAGKQQGVKHTSSMYIVSVDEKINNGDGGATPIPQPDDVVCSSTPNQQSSFTRAKFLNSKIQAARESSSTLTGHQDTIPSQLKHYLTDVCEEHVDDGLAFWGRKLPRYNKLSDLGKDLMAAPASQVYVERIFSLCGQLTVGRRNRMTKSLEMRAFLKLNAGLCHLVACRDLQSCIVY